MLAGTYPLFKAVPLASNISTNGQEYGPNASGKRYISLDYHRAISSKKAKSKSRKKSKSKTGHKQHWIPTFTRPQEYALFCTADSEDWQDLGHYWAVHNSGATVLGVRGERLAKFTNKSRATHVPWHGYPLSLCDGEEERGPSDEFVDQWIEEEVVSKELGRKIQKGKV